MQKVLFSLVLALLSIYPQACSAEDEGRSDSNKYIYLSLGTPLVLNLSTRRDRLTFLQLEADVLIRGTASKEIVKPHIPAIRHQLVLLLSEQDEADMKSPTKREEIRHTATVRVQEVMAGLTGRSDVTDLLFSSFLVQ